MELSWKFISLIPNIIEDSKNEATVFDYDWTTPYPFQNTTLNVDQDYYLGNIGEIDRDSTPAELDSSLITQKRGLCRHFWINKMDVVGSRIH